MMMPKILSLQQIREFLIFHQVRLRFDKNIPTITNLAERAGISRQTIYAIIGNERSEFGEIAQIRLSRVISQISSDPSYKHSKVARIDFTSTSPRIRFGL